jgi:hypothetical protein
MFHPGCTSELPAFQLLLSPGCGIDGARSFSGTNSRFGDRNLLLTWLLRNDERGSGKQSTGLPVPAGPRVHGTNLSRYM